MRRKASLTLLFVTFLLAVSLAGACGGGSGGSGDGGSDDGGSAGGKTTGSSGQASGYPLTVTDSVGREVEIGSRPKKVASMAPSITETLFAVGAGNRVVGVSTADDYPREVEAIEKVGDIGETNEEKIVSLGVDVLFVSFDDTTRQVAEDLEQKTRAEVVVVNPKSVNGAISSIGSVAKVVGEAEKGEVVEERLRDELRQLQKSVAGEPEPTVFYEVWGDPLQTAGPGSFIDDAIKLAGGENVAADTEEPYPTYSKEVLLQKDPEYYLVGRSSGIPAQEIARRSGYPALSAVREDRVEVVNDDLVVRPGPRIVEGVREIAETIHPEASE